MKKFFTFEELLDRKKKVDDYQKRLMSPLMPRGRLTPQQRKKKIQIYKQKRNKRNWKNNLNY